MIRIRILLANQILTFNISTASVYHEKVNQFSLPQMLSQQLGFHTDTFIPRFILLMNMNHFSNQFQSTSSYTIQFRFLIATMKKLKQ